MEELDYEQALSDLWDMISGKVFPFSKGLVSYTKGRENQTKLHEAILDLESRGLVDRKEEGYDYVVWSPVEGKVWEAKS